VVDFVLHELQDGTQRLLNLPPGASTGQRMTDLFPDCTIDGRLSALRAVVETGRPFELVRPATPTRPDLILSFTRTASGDVAAVSVPGDPRPDEATAERDAVRWQRLFEDTPLGICVATFAEGEVIEANRVLLAMLDRTSEEVIGARFTSFTSPGDPTRIDRERLLRTGHATMEKRYLRGDGRELWLRVASSLVVEDGEHRILSICEDVTEAHRARAQLAHRADHDALTGLPNRERLRRRLRTLLEDVRAGRSDGVGLLFLDLDRFKVINDSLGHAAGDRLLREVAGRLQRSTPPDDLLARLGGDEFALVTGDHLRAAELAERLVEVLEAPFDLDGREVTVGASIGVSVREALDQATATSPTRTRCCARPTRRCTPPSGPARVRSSSSRTRCAGAPSPGSRTSRACAGAAARRAARALPADRALGRPALSASRRWCAGSTPSAACSARRLPARRRRRPAWSSRSGSTCCVEALLGARGLARTGAPGRMSVNVSAQHLAAGTLGDDVAQALELSRPAAGRTSSWRSPSRRSSSATRGRRRARRSCASGGARSRSTTSAPATARWPTCGRLPVDVLKIDRTFVTGAADGEQRRPPALRDHGRSARASGSGPSSRASRPRASCRPRARPARRTSRATCSAARAVPALPS
jgi:diguanylate cyclase (GGDEF)-like protein/PAS domain S-box-containing protein